MEGEVSWRGSAALLFLSRSVSQIGKSRTNLHLGFIINTNVDDLMINKWPPSCIIFCVLDISSSVIINYHISAKAPSIMAG